MTEKSPTQRTKELFEGRGWSVCVVEQRLHGGKRKDAFGFADLLAVKIGEAGTLYIQATTVDNMAARVEKIRANAEAPIVLATGNKIVVVGWKDVRVPGARPVYVERIRSVEPADFRPSLVPQNGPK